VWKLQPDAFFQQEGASMQGDLTRIGLIGLVVTCVIVSFSFSVQAEKKKITYSKKSKQFVSQTTVYPGDVPNHELVQFVRVDTVTTISDPDFEMVEQLAYGQLDQVAGTGSHRGYTTFIHKSGEKSYVSWEGTHKTAVKEGGAWETPYEGKFQFTG
jgi:hypothetical protein